MTVTYDEYGCPDYSESTLASEVTGITANKVTELTLADDPPSPLVVVVQTATNAADTMYKPPQNFILLVGAHYSINGKVITLTQGIDRRATVYIVNGSTWAITKTIILST